MRTVSAVVGLLFLVCCGVLGAEAPVVSTVQDFRKSWERSLPSLNFEISRVCASRAAALAEAGVLSHSDALERGPALQMLANGFPPGEYGEVLGSGARWEDVWTAWLQSQPHRTVLLTPEWTEWGWGRADTGQTTVWVVRFYRP